MEQGTNINLLLANKRSVFKIKIRAKSVIFLAPFILLFFSGNAQVNFVPNPSFEIFDTCPQSYNSINYAKPWNHLKTGGGCAPEFWHKCANPNPQVGVPYNGMGQNFQYPRTGDGYSNMTWYQNNATATALREYIQTPLTDTLTLGKTYCVTYYVNLANRSKYAIDELGAYFDDGTVTGIQCQPIALTPQVQSPINFFMSDTLGWMKIQSTFTAQGYESYITIGSFKAQAATNFTLVNSSVGTTLADYYVDDVSVIELNLPAYAGPDKYIAIGDSAFIGRPPEIGLDCIWFQNSTQIGSDAGLWVKPAVTSTYTVRQDICGILKTDTVVVYVGGVGINEKAKQNKVSALYPNPNNGIFCVEITNDVKMEYEFAIYDITGEKVFSQKFLQNKFEFKTDLPKGLYHAVLKSQNIVESAYKLVISN